MIKVLNPTVHGVLDYVLALAFLLLPGVLDFSDTAAGLSYIVGVLVLGVSLLTSYPLGALKLIPFPVHGALEAITAAAWLVFPWLFGFAGAAAARNFFVIAGAGLLLAAALTDYRATGTRAAFSGKERRHRMIDRRRRSMPVACDRRVDIADRRGGAYAGA